MNQAFQLSEQEIKRVGATIWKNECGLKKENLIFWNVNEEFPSLGIGHFIWHTTLSQSNNTQQFPELMSYLKMHKVPISHWMCQRYAPWKNREQFLSDCDSIRMKELLKILANTIDLQAQFIVDRFQKNSLLSMPKLLANAEQKHLNKQLDRLSNVPGGYVALIDYANFKGDGTNPREQYKNQGWGLMQVLLHMKEMANPLQDFVTSAQEILASRVANSPQEKNEQRWLLGWNNRLKSYLNVNSI